VWTVDRGTAVGWADRGGGFELGQRADQVVISSVQISWLSVDR